MGWEQPPENSLAALVHGMQVSDGVELDLRLSADDELVAFHDTRTADGRFPECEDSSSMPDYVCTFDEMLSEPGFTKPWLEGGKFACIELKTPHPSSGKTGWLRSGQARTEHMRRMIELVDEALEPLDIGESSTVVYSFEPKLLKAAKKSGSKLRFARLVPYLRPWGNSFVKRVFASPYFIGLSLPMLMQLQRNVGAPMLPAALDYLEGTKRHLTIGTTVGLQGRQLTNLTRKRKGFPVYVWPAKLRVERALLEAGLTAISDELSPELTTLPTGEARWLRPATQPLNEKNQSLLDSASPEQHASVIAELQREVSPWPELSNSQKRKFIEGWRKKWLWGRDVDTLMSESQESSMPWEACRVIGHRGAGRTYGTG
ncbi:MAG: glycerophosphodiester phosphodiesterase [Candidatus Thermoplasmatota archaeon]|nr:glycerophosphodiester phosphodiesterase [Candidatus Thermoplasmatota archaeon]